MAEQIQKQFQKEIQNLENVLRQEFNDKIDGIYDKIQQLQNQSDKKTNNQIQQENIYSYDKSQTSTRINLRNLSKDNHMKGFQNTLKSPDSRQSKSKIRKDQTNKNDKIFFQPILQQDQKLSSPLSTLLNLQNKSRTNRQQSQTLTSQNYYSQQLTSKSQVNGLIQNKKKQNNNKKEISMINIDQQAVILSERGDNSQTPLVGTSQNISFVSLQNNQQQIKNINKSRERSKQNKNGNQINFLSQRSSKAGIPISKAQMFKTSQNINDHKSKVGKKENTEQIVQQRQKEAKEEDNLRINILPENNSAKKNIKIVEITPTSIKESIRKEFSQKSQEKVLQILTSVEKSQSTSNLMTMKNSFANLRDDILIIKNLPLMETPEPSSSRHNRDLSPLRQQISNRQTIQNANSQIKFFLKDLQQNQLLMTDEQNPQYSNSYQMSVVSNTDGGYLFTAGFKDNNFYDDQYSELKIRNLELDINPTEDFE